MMPAKTALSPATAIAEPPAQLRRLHELCGFHASASKELTLLHARLEREYIALIGRHKEEILQLEEAKKASLAGIEEIARQNMGWFGEKRQLKTPFGVIKFTATSALSIASTDRTVNKLFARGQRLPGFDPMLYITMDTKLDKEALEKLPAEVLERLGVVVVQGDSFKFTPLIVDLKQVLADSTLSPEQAAA